MKLVGAISLPRQSRSVLVRNKTCLESSVGLPNRQLIRVSMHFLRDMNRLLVAFLPIAVFVVALWQAATIVAAFETELSLELSGVTV